MSRPVPYLFCRYHIRVGGSRLSGREQYDLLREIKGQKVAHRKSRPVEADYTTFAMMPNAFEVDDRMVLVWNAGYRVRVRQEVDYDPERDVLETRLVDAQGVRYERFVAIPELDVVAISDGSVEPHIGARQAVARFQSVIKGNVTHGEADIRLAATNVDVDRALRSWGLSEFSFSVRPFNPHVGVLGARLHEELVRDGTASLRGVAKATPGQEMRMAEGGFIEEAVGLAQAGYGQFGLKGTTPEGRYAQYGKPAFSLEKRKNEAVQARPQVLRVFMEPQLTDREDQTEVARALLDFYDPERD